jgi:hypothetical protein
MVSRPEKFWVARDMFRELIYCAYERRLQGILRRMNALYAHLTNFEVRNMNKKVFGSALLVMIVLGSLALWINHKMQAQLVFANGSGSELSKISILVGNSIIWQGSLKPSEAIKANFSPNKDSDFLIEGILLGKEVSARFGYTTGGDLQTHVVTATPDGNFLYSVIKSTLFNRVVFEPTRL